jgi:hypothetical protein
MGTSEIRFTIITADGVSVSNEYKHVPGGILVSELGSYKMIHYEDILKVTEENIISTDITEKVLSAKGILTIAD